MIRLYPKFMFSRVIIHLPRWCYTRTDLRLPFSSNFSRLKNKNVDEGLMWLMM